MTIEKIENFDLADVPKDLEEDGDILDDAYERNKVVGLPLPLIQWCQKENNYIRIKLQKIFDNTTAWLNIHGVQMKPFQTELF